MSTASPSSDAVLQARKAPPQRRNKDLCADAGYRGKPVMKVITEHGCIANVVDRRKEAGTSGEIPPRCRQGAGLSRCATAGSTESAN